MHFEELDLFVGGDFGAWALDNVDPGTVCKVIASDERCLSRARERGFEVGRLGDGVQPARTKRGMSAHFGQIIDEETLGRYDSILNVHPGFLPWGRGFYPVFWALWEGTPAGATVHVIDRGVDTGAIVEQVSVAWSESDTGATLHRRVRRAEETLFLKWMPIVASGGVIPTRAQDKSEGSYHRKSEFLELKKAASLETMSALSLVRLVRCLSYPGYTGLELTIGGQRFSMELTRLDS